MDMYIYHVDEVLKQNHEYFFLEYLPYIFIAPVITIQSITSHIKTNNNLSLTKRGNYWKLLNRRVKIVNHLRNHNLFKKILERKIEGKRKRGSPRLSYLQQVNEKLGVVAYQGVKELVENSSDDCSTDKGLVEFRERSPLHVKWG